MIHLFEAEPDYNIVISSLYGDVLTHAGVYTYSRTDHYYYVISKTNHTRRVRSPAYRRYVIVFILYDVIVVVRTRVCVDARFSIHHRIARRWLYCNGVQLLIDESLVIIISHCIHTCSPVGYRVSRP